jgi:hypothetical protein
MAARERSRSSCSSMFSHARNRRGVTSDEVALRSEKVACSKHSTKGKQVNLLPKSLARALERRADWALQS